MAANTQPLFPNSPVIGIGTLTSATAVTSRANITGTTGLVALTAASTNGKRVDAITVKGKGTTAATIVSIWMNDGTTSYLLDEFDCVSTTPSTTTDSVSVTKTYANLVLPATYRLYISETVQADMNVFAFGGDY